MDSNIEMMHVADERGRACFCVTSRDHDIGYSSLDYMFQECGSARRLGAKGVNTDVVAPGNLCMTVMAVRSCASTIHNRNAPSTTLSIQTDRGSSIDAQRGVEPPLTEQFCGGPIGGKEREKHGSCMVGQGQNEQQAPDAVDAQTPVICRFSVNDIQRTHDEQAGPRGDDDHEGPNAKCGHEQHVNGTVLSGKAGLLVLFKSKLVQLW